MFITIRNIEKKYDERGFFSEIFHVLPQNIKQVNLSYTYPGVIRAWHKHERGQFDHFVVLRGSAKICATDGQTIEEVIVSGDVLQEVKVDGKAWHGFKAIGNEPVLLLYGVTNEYDPKNPDEIRRYWNSYEIPYDWNKDPHK